MSGRCDGLLSVYLLYVLHEVGISISYQMSDILIAACVSETIYTQCYFGPSFSPPILSS